MRTDVVARLASVAERRNVAAWNEAATLIRDAGEYRWVGLYEVTATDIGAIAWTGTVAPAFPRFPKDKGLNGVAVATKQPVISQDVASDPRYLTAFATTGSEAIFPVVSETGEVAFLCACAAAISGLWVALLPGTDSLQS